MAAVRGGSRRRTVVRGARVTTDKALQKLQHAYDELASQLRALRATQDRIELARADYTDLFDFAPVTYALLDSAGMILQINLAACHLLESERAHLIGHSFLTFVSRQDRREFLEHLRLCRNGNGVIESEFRLLPSSGRPVTCRLFSKRASYQKRDAFPTVVVDQTERLALDNARLAAERDRMLAQRESSAARAASAAKDRFLATVSHELRTPLTPALFAASSLASCQGLPEQARELASTVKRNIEFEVRLIDDLLDVARIGRDRITLELEPLDAHAVVDEAVGICRPSAERKNLTLAVNLDAPAHYVMGDRARLRQVFWNLLNNAIKFTGVGGRVAVQSLNVGDGILRVCIRDNGAGMDVPLLESLFAPFDRRPIGTESRGGLGLGLAICKGILGAHGGQIWASSQGSGLGSTLAVELGIVSQPSPAADPRPTVEVVPADSLPAAAPPLRVLVIEDDVESGEMLALLLAQSGYDVEVASSVDGGTRKLGGNWDVVLSDIGLPDGSGLEIARRARTLPRPPGKLIALSGYGSPEDIRASHEAGFDEHVVKPIDLDHLLMTLSAQLTARPD